MPAGPGRGHKKKKNIRKLLIKKISVCPLCGLKTPITPHHIIPRTEGGSDENNIIWLCKKCHDEIEENWKYWISYFQRLLAREDNLYDN